jgi:kojibiose phosphorylase
MIDKPGYNSMPDQFHEWLVSEERFDQASQHSKETIFTIGNGVFSTRGAFEEGYPGDRRATLMHGVFDDVPVVVTELANLPDWLEMDIFLAGEPFSLAKGQLLDYRRQLDLRSGLLTRQLTWKSPQGRVSALKFERFTSLAEPHLAFIRLTVAPQNYSGAVEARAGINACADTEGLLHWLPLQQGTRERTAWLEAQTRASGIRLGMAIKLALELPGAERLDDWDAREHPTVICQAPRVDAGETAVFHKIAALYTTRTVTDPLNAALNALAELDHAAWETALAASASQWQREWDACDVVIEGDLEAQMAMRFNIFQLLIAAPRDDERVNIGAKTLSGFGYRGHAFWDTEIFMLPVFTYTRPEIARNLLSYRYHTLDGARKKARGNGFNGAQFAWESAATGEEVTPTWVPHPTDRAQLVRIWTGDIEIHVSSDIAYAIWQYWRATGDNSFMLQRGAEIILETARFWASRAEWDEAAGRYEYNNVIGPDENHDRIDNNAYTNYFARWHLGFAAWLLDWLHREDPVKAAQLTTALALTPAELAKWRDVADKLYCHYDPQSKLIEQFEGYFKRTDLNLDDFEPRSLSMQVILGIEGACDTQILKQPDVLMLLYLHPELFGPDVVRANYDYYTPRTDHSYGSSLGPSIQAIMSCQVGDVDAAYEHFMRSARADLFDVRGNAGDGIHGASAGGLWQAVVFGFAGLVVSETGYTVNPHLPRHWKRVRFNLNLRGQTHPVDIRNPEA